MKISSLVASVENLGLRVEIHAANREIHFLQGLRDLDQLELIWLTIIAVLTMDVLLPVILELHLEVHMLA